MGETTIELHWTIQEGAPAIEAPVPEVVSGGCVANVDTVGRLLRITVQTFPVVLRTSHPETVQLHGAQEAPNGPAIPLGRPLAVILRPDEGTRSPASRFVMSNGRSRGGGRIIESMACFGPQTRIATPEGARSVAALRAGDVVLTRDNGIQPVLWVGSIHVDPDDFARFEQLAPVVISPGALGPSQPGRALTVSPSHRMLIADNAAALNFGEREVLVRAQDLVALDKAKNAPLQVLDWYQVLLPEHEIILAEGAWCESLQPAPDRLLMLSKQQRDHIDALIPDMAAASRTGRYTAARAVLKPGEAQLLGQDL